MVEQTELAQHLALLLQRHLHMLSWRHVHLAWLYVAVVPFFFSRHVFAYTIVRLPNTSDETSRKVDNAFQ